MRDSGALATPAGGRAWRREGVGGGVRGWEGAQGAQGRQRPGRQHCTGRTAEAPVTHTPAPSWTAARAGLCSPCPAVTHPAAHTGPLPAAPARCQRRPGGRQTGPASWRAGRGPPAGAAGESGRGGGGGGGGRGKVSKKRLVDLLLASCR
jgi:hypothetical protein